MTEQTEGGSSRKRGLGVRWRGWNRVLHRTLGYLCAGLTIVYAVSGLAVNHVADWNPNYIIRNDTVALDAVSLEASRSPDFTDRLLAAFELGGPIQGMYRPDPERLDVFVEGGAIEVELTTGIAVYESVRDRPVLRAFNILHLNEPKGIWTAAADLFAVALLLLALTGLFMVKGRKGVLGRGGVYVATGILLPLIYLWLWR